MSLAGVVPESKSPVQDLQHGPSFRFLSRGINNPVRTPESEMIEMLAFLSQLESFLGALNSFLRWFF